MKSNCLIAALIFLLMVSAGRAVVDDAHSFALEAATPYVKAGFTVREEHWSGAVPAKQRTTITHQLFKGNEYWFWLASDEEKAVVNVHIYDSKGKLVEAEAFQKGHMAGARVVPSTSGTYYIVFMVESSPLKRTSWSIAYGFK